MGVHLTLDKRDFYPVEKAARIAHTLTKGELHVEEPELRWSYTMVVSETDPGLACVAIHDEEAAFVGYWCD